MAKANIIHMTGKPKLSLGDLYEFPLIRLDAIQDNRPYFDKVYVDTVAVLHKNRLKSDDGWIRVVSNRNWSDKYTSPDERLKEIGSLVQGKGRVPTSFLIENYLKRLNDTLSDMWENKNFTSVEIILMDVVGHNNEVRVYNKKKARVPDWKRTGLPKNVHTRTKKPTKMESKKMYKSPVKKGNTLMKSCKRMTGNIEVLGKNFNKLI